MRHGIRETLAYHRDQRQTWLAVRDKFREPKPRAQGRTVRQVPRSLPSTRGEQLGHASTGLRDEFQDGACVLGIVILSLSVLAGIGVGLYHIVERLPSLMPSLQPHAWPVLPFDMIADDMIRASEYGLAKLLRFVALGLIVVGGIMVGVGNWRENGICLIAAMVIQFLFAPFIARLLL